MGRPSKSDSARQRAQRIASALSNHLGEPPSVTATTGRQIACSNCGHPMEVVTRGGLGIEIDICGDCGGIWLDVGELDTLLAEVAVAPEPADRQTLRREVHVHTIDSQLGVEYRKCPRCATVMMRRNFGGISGVIIDECSVHGVFLDAGELEALETFIRLGGLKHGEETQAKVTARQQRQQPKVPPPQHHRPSGGGGLSQLWTLLFG